MVKILNRPPPQWYTNTQRREPSGRRKSKSQQEPPSRPQGKSRRRELTRFGKEVENGNLHTVLAGTQRGAVAVGNGWQSLKMLHTELPRDPAIPLRGSFPERNENTSPEIPVQECSRQHYSTGKKQKQPRSPHTDKWTNKMWSLCTTEYCPAVKGRSFQYTLPHGWTVKRDAKWKDTHSPRPRRAWLHLYEMCPTDKSLETKVH